MKQAGTILRVHLWSRKTQEQLNVSEILQLAEIKDFLIDPGLCHFYGMLEFWNSGTLG